MSTPARPTTSKPAAGVSLPPLSSPTAGATPFGAGHRRTDHIRSITSRRIQQTGFSPSLLPVGELGVGVTDGTGSGTEGGGGKAPKAHAGLLASNPSWYASSQAQIASHAAVTASAAALTSTRSMGRMPQLTPGGMVRGDRSVLSPTMSRSQSFAGGGIPSFSASTRRHASGPTSPLVSRGFLEAVDGVFNSPTVLSQAADAFSHGATAASEPVVHHVAADDRGDESGDDYGDEAFDVEAGDTVHPLRSDAAFTTSASGLRRGRSETGLGSSTRGGAGGRRLVVSTRTGGAGASSSITKVRGDAVTVEEGFLASKIRHPIAEVMNAIGRRILSGRPTLTPLDLAGGTNIKDLALEIARLQVGRSVEPGNMTSRHIRTLNLLRQLIGSETPIQDPATPETIRADLEILQKEVVKTDVLRAHLNSSVNPLQGILKIALLLQYMPLSSDWLKEAHAYAKREFVKTATSDPNRDLLRSVDDHLKSALEAVTAYEIAAADSNYTKPYFNPDIKLDVRRVEKKPGKESAAYVHARDAFHSHTRDEIEEAETRRRLDEARALSERVRASLYPSLLEGMGGAEHAAQGSSFRSPYRSYSSLPVRSGGRPPLSATDSFRTEHLGGALLSPTSGTSPVADFPDPYAEVKEGLSEKLRRVIAEKNVHNRLAIARAKIMHYRNRVSAIAEERSDLDHRGVDTIVSGEITAAGDRWLLSSGMWDHRDKIFDDDGNLKPDVPRGEPIDTISAINETPLPPSTDVVLEDVIAYQLLRKNSGYEVVERDDGSYLLKFNINPTAFGGHGDAEEAELLIDIDGEKIELSSPTIRARREEVQTILSPVAQTVAAARSGVPFVEASAAPRRAAAPTITLGSDLQNLILQIRALAFAGEAAPAFAGDAVRYTSIIPFSCQRSISNPRASQVSLPAVRDAASASAVPLTVALGAELRAGLGRGGVSNVVPTSAFVSVSASAPASSAPVKPATPRRLAPLPSNVAGRTILVESNAGASSPEVEGSPRTPVPTPLGGGSRPVVRLQGTSSIVDEFTQTARAGGRTATRSRRTPFVVSSGLLDATGLDEDGVIHPVELGDPRAELKRILTNVTTLRRVGAGGIGPNKVFDSRWLLESFILDHVIPDDSVGIIGTAHALTRQKEFTIRLPLPIKAGGIEIAEITIRVKEPSDDKITGTIYVDCDSLFTPDSLPDEKNPNTEAIANIISKIRTKCGLPVPEHVSERKVDTVLKFSYAGRTPYIDSRSPKPSAQASATASLPAAPSSDGVARALSFADTHAPSSGASLSASDPAVENLIAMIDEMESPRMGSGDASSIAAAAVPSSDSAVPSSPERAVGLNSAPVSSPAISLSAAAVDDAAAVSSPRRGESEPAVAATSAAASTTSRAPSSLPPIRGVRRVSVSTGGDASTLAASSRAADDTAASLPVSPRVGDASTSSSDSAVPSAAAVVGTPRRSDASSSSLGSVAPSVIATTDDGTAASSPISPRVVGDASASSSDSIAASAAAVVATPRRSDASSSSLGSVASSAASHDGDALASAPVVDGDASTSSANSTAPSVVATTDDTVASSPASARDDGDSSVTASGLGSVAASPRVGDASASSSDSIAASAAAVVATPRSPRRSDASSALSAAAASDAAASSPSSARADGDASVAAVDASTNAAPLSSAARGIDAATNTEPLSSAGSAFININNRNEASIAAGVGAASDSPSRGVDASTPSLPGHSSTSSTFAAGGGVNIYNTNAFTLHLGLVHALPAASLPQPSLAAAPSLSAASPSVEPSVAAPSASAMSPSVEPSAAAPSLSAAPPSTEPSAAVPSVSAAVSTAASTPPSIAASAPGRLWDSTTEATLNPDIPGDDPSTSIKATLYMPITEEKYKVPGSGDEKENIWGKGKSSGFTGGSDFERANKFRVINGVYKSSKTGDYERKREIQDQLEQTFLDIIVIAAQDSGLTYTQVLQAIEIAKKQGGITNKKVDSGPNPYEAATPTDADYELLQDFSAAFQEQAEKCGIFTGRQEDGYKKVGLRLPFLPSEVIDRLGEIEAKFKSGHIPSTELTGVRSRLTPIKRAVADQMRGRAI